MDLTLWLHKEEVKWFSEAYASNTSRSIEPDKQSNRLQIHTRSEVMAIEGKQIPGVEAPRGV